MYEGCKNVSKKKHGSVLEALDNTAFLLLQSIGTTVNMIRRRKIMDVEKE